MTGDPAMLAVASLLPISRELLVQTTMGVVLVKPATVWSCNRMLVSASTMSVVYTVDDRLYEWSTQAFLRDEWLNALSVGAQRARGMVTLAKAEMALIQGILVPWYTLLGVSCGRLAIFYLSNRQSVDRSLANGVRVLRILQTLRAEHRTLFDKLFRRVMKDVLEHMPESLSSEDVAFFVGRVIRGVDGSPEVALGGVVKIALTVATLVSLTHLPSITVHAANHAAQERASELQARLRDGGYTVTPAEAEDILKDAFSKPGIEAALKELQMASKELVPSLEAVKTILIPGR